VYLIVVSYDIRARVYLLVYLVQLRILLSLQVLLGLVEFIVSHLLRIIIVLELATRLLDLFAVLEQLVLRLLDRVCKAALELVLLIHEFRVLVAPLLNLTLHQVVLRLVLLLVLYYHQKQVKFTI
jgi:hypothetical protein